MLVYCDAVFDPAVTARARKLEHAPSDYSFGGFEDVMAHLKQYLSQHEYAAGERFTAADTQLGSSLAFTVHVLGVVPLEPEFAAYLERLSGRPAYRRSQALDAELAQSLAG
jgi:glutathione S-transferase